ncbi:MAG: Crp/Fnr family transcriptional regulator [Candidatus Eremiobacteraeota bacterium]|nr:Crp/Fnr family transcriptional regulator [Candidatus Eremiobacteraeota bacterium]MCW5869879.1 Crp/Fnr family transcriptional regulator [Candidatus Eremiobacteraeota bacterium]
MQAQDFADLRSFPLFSGLSPTDAERLQHFSQVLHFPAGGTIFDEAQPARALYLVQSGQVKIYKINPRGLEQILAVIPAGQTFAEAAVFMGGKYPASAQCLEDSRVVSVERQALLQLMGQDPELALRMMAGMALKLRRLVSLVEDLTLHDARGRLARYLAALAEGNCVTLPTQQNVLARLLGLTSETLSRTFKTLRDEGILGPLQGRRMEILDRPGLLQAGDQESDS